ncbi:MAG: HD domain-containing protein [Lachnospiraceae bacterium]|nr:HD domain-containing protein [Lachnospiraceae bacterium]
MAVSTFAAIDVGSYNVMMEIFEVRRSGLRSLTTLRRRLLLGRDTYSDHRISMDSLNELTRILKDYADAMKEYGVSAYRACAKSAFREAGNSMLIVEHVKKKTGITIDILSNSEQRFLGYKSIASKGEDFARIIEKGTAIVDVGGGSIQISLFDKDTLVTTANLLLGSLRVSGRLASLENETEHPDILIDQLIRKDILNFKRMYLKDRNIDTLILVGDYFTNLIFQNRADMNKFETRDEFLGWYNKVVNMTSQEAAEYLGVGMEAAHAVLPTAVLYRRLIEVLGASTVWLPGIQLTDGIAYDYGLEARIIKSSHDFDRDILTAARNIMKRYAGNKPHTEKIMEISDEIFKAIRKNNFLSDRDRLLLKVACCLHDCGKYVSLVNVSECSYNIIKSTEIIGLSERERMIIANVVKYNTIPFDFHEELSRSIPEEDYLRVAKLTAILRLSNGLDQSYLQKIEQIKASRKDEKLIIEVAVKEDFTLEKGLFGENVGFFEGIFDVKPLLKIRKKIS